MTTDKAAGKKVLVTGASGFIGTHLVRRLVSEGYSVCTFGRSSSLPRGLRDLDIEHFSGDVTNMETVASAVEGRDIVFHLAGLVSYKMKDANRQIAVNVYGTRNVMQACLAKGVKRVIHTSSIAALGMPEKDGSVGDETITYNLGGRGLNYCDSKYAAELEVMETWHAGLPVLILCPGIIFGEGDTHPHHLAIFTALSRGSLIGVPAGGVTFSDIEDVVDAHVKAITQGRTGERYCLVSDNLTYRQAAEIFARERRGRPPLFEIPAPILTGIGSLVEGIYVNLKLKGDPPVSRQAAWLAGRKIFFSSKKAQEELDFQPTPFAETMRRTAPYYLSFAARKKS